MRLKRGVDFIMLLSVVDHPLPQHFQAEFVLCLLGLASCLCSLLGLALPSVAFWVSLDRD